MSVNTFEYANQLLAENERLKQQVQQLGSENSLMLADYRDIPEMRRIGKPTTPSTDAWLNEVRAQGIHFAVNRMLAAWESGFVNDTPAQAYDISGGFLTALEFLPNASPDEFKRDYADEVRSAIAAQLRAGEKS